MNTSPLFVATTLAAENGRGLTDNISMGSSQPGNRVRSARTSPSVSGGQSGSTNLPSNPCAFAVVFIAGASSALH
jgi:hypothetical protein